MSWINAKSRLELVAWWEARNPVVPRGGLAVELDTGKVKIGDGRSTWSTLDYIGTDSRMLTPAGSGIPSDYLSMFDVTNPLVVVDLSEYGNDVNYMGYIPDGVSGWYQCVAVFRQGSSPVTGAYVTTLNGFASLSESANAVETFLLVGSSEDGVMSVANLHTWPSEF